VLLNIPPRLNDRGPIRPMVLGQAPVHSPVIQSEPPFADSFQLERRAGAAALFSYVANSHSHGATNCGFYQAGSQEPAPLGSEILECDGLPAPDLIAQRYRTRGVRAGGIGSAATSRRRGRFPASACTRRWSC